MTINIRARSSRNVVNGEAIAVLPEGFRPSGYVSFSASFVPTGSSAEYAVHGDVEETGSVKIWYGSNAPDPTALALLIGSASFVAQ